MPSPILSGDQESAIRRFVGRFRSNTHPKRSKTLPSQSPRPHDQSSSTNGHVHFHSQRKPSHQHSQSQPQHRLKHSQSQQQLKHSHSHSVSHSHPHSQQQQQQHHHHHLQHTRSTNFRSMSVSKSSSPERRPATSATYKRPFNTYHYQNYARDADISLGLWNSAYDYLRDRPQTAGLVLAYEAIISQELPDQLKVGINTTLRHHPGERRLELVTAIALSGLRKRRASKSSHVDEFSRQILDASKDSVGLMLDAYPSAALAFAGICALTPLPLDPVLRRGTMRDGVRHVAGRIQWYMFLSQLLMPETWRDEHAFRRQQAMEETRELVHKLYRKVLEFEMNCVCASASSWNNAAKNVVGWQTLGALIDAIRAADRELYAYVERYCTESAMGRLLPLNRDFDAVSTGFFAELGASPVMAQTQWPTVQV